MSWIDDGDKNGFHAWVRANAKVGGNTLQDGLTRGHIVQTAFEAWKAALRSPGARAARARTARRRAQRPVR